MVHKNSCFQSLTFSFTVYSLHVSYIRRRGKASKEGEGETSSERSQEDDLGDQFESEEEEERNKKRKEKKRTLI